VLQQHNTRLRREAARAHDGGSDDGSGSDDSETADELRDFLAWMEHVRAITEAVTELRVLGCIEYRDFDVQAAGGELSVLAEDAVAAVAAFRDELAKQRERCIHLTFFNGPQLWLLSDALLDETERADTSAAEALLQYVHPDAQLPAQRAPAMRCARSALMRAPMRVPLTRPRATGAGPQLQAQVQRHGGLRAAVGGCKRRAARPAARLPSHAAAQPARRRRLLRHLRGAQGARRAAALLHVAQRCASLVLRARRMTDVF
jgi:hypothetical protein